MFLDNVTNFIVSDRADRKQTVSPSGKLICDAFKAIPLRDLHIFSERSEISAFGVQRERVVNISFLLKATFLATDKHRQ